MLKHLERTEHTADPESTPPLISQFFGKIETVGHYARLHSTLVLLEEGNNHVNKV